MLGALFVLYVNRLVNVNAGSLRMKLESMYTQADCAFANPSRYVPEPLQLKCIVCTSHFSANYIFQNSVLAV